MEKREEWATRWGFLLAAIGMAVGTGNIWRFPRMAAMNGGGAFVLAYTLFLFLWSAPLLMAEMVLGRKTRRGCIGAFRDFMGPRFTWMGAWMGWVCLGIMFYYSVVMGWCVNYFLLGAQGAFTPGVNTEAIWTSFLANPTKMIFLHFVSMTIAGVLIYKGVKTGIEAACKVMIPALFGLLIIAAIRALTLPGAASGLDYMFIPRWEYLSRASTWLQALTQSAWSTGAGWGLLLTYAVYTREQEDIGQNAFSIGFGDQTAALIAGLAVLPTVFALAPTVDYANKALAAGNTGLTFIYLTDLFTRMIGGRIIAPLFFLAMVFAALTSLMSMVELGARMFMDAGWSRKRAVLFVAIAGFLLGVPSAYSCSVILENQDWVWGVGLLVSGLFSAIAIIKYGAEKARKEMINTRWTDMYIGRWWSYVITYVTPVLFVLVTGWWLWQSITWYPDTWWRPTEVYSVGTIAVQWGIALIVLYLLNNWFARVTLPGEAEVAGNPGRKEAK